VLLTSEMSRDEENAARRRTSTLARHVAGSTHMLCPGAVAGGLLSDMRSFIFGTVDETMAHVGDRIAEVFVAHGIKFVFCLAGGHISPILVGASNAGIRVIDTRHEVNAVFAADAVGRITGKPSVAAVTAGPGVTNTVTAVKNAAMAQSPLVLLGGAAPLGFKGAGALQDIDQRSFIEPIVKTCYTVTTVRDIVPTLREAFCEAVSGVPGPVFVELPLDLLFPYLFIASEAGLYKAIPRSELIDGDVRKVVVPVEDPLRDIPKSREVYLASLKPSDTVFLRPDNPNYLTQAYFRYRYADARRTVDVSPLPVHIPLSSAKDVQFAAGCLRKAQRPVLLLGSQCTLQPGLAMELQAAVQRMGIPTFLGGMARGLLGRDHPCFIRQNRGHALKNSDLVILAGTVVDFRLQYGKALPKGTASIIAISRDPEHLELNTGFFAALSGRGWKPTLASEGDACDFVLRLEKVVGDSVAGKVSQWTEKLKASETSKEADNRKRGEQVAIGRGARAGTQLINPLSVVHCLDDVLLDNACLVADGGDFVATASYVVRPRGPLKWLDPGSFGTLGVGGGFALGAKLACPEDEVWLLWGDGAAGYSIAEFDTFARHGVPVIALVGNDACWGQIERDQKVWFGSDVSCTLEYTHYETIAEGYGGIGLSVTSPTDDVTGTLLKAQQLARERGKPVLINVLVGRSDFRDGSISV